MISNAEMIRIRRQMQRRIHDVVAQRRRDRLMEPASGQDAQDDTRPTADTSSATV